MTAASTRAFATLHGLLQQLEDAEQRLQHGPKRIATAKKKVLLGEAACDQQKEAVKQLRKSADQSSMNLKSREAEVTKLNLRLNEASSNKEYEIIQTKIASEKAADAKLEDEILGLLDQVDTASDELQTLEQQLRDFRQQVVDIETDVAEKTPGLEATIERLNTEIGEAESAIPGGESAGTYKRLRVAQGASALSAVEDGYCVECNTGITPQDAVRLNMGEFLLCRACGRILYRADSTEE